MWDKNFYKRDKREKHKGKEELMTVKRSEGKKDKELRRKRRKFKYLSHIMWNEERYGLLQLTLQREDQARDIFRGWPYEHDSQ